MKILLATDGSDCSRSAVEAVADRPWPEGSEVKVLSVMELPYLPTTETWMLPETYFKEVEGATTERAEDAVNQAKERLKSSAANQLVISAEIASGSAKDVILDAAENWGADLIVVGSHGVNGWRRFLLGSVSHAVATHAHCSVEIVRRRTPGAQASAETM
jgi:nucleotide-binding universal stress UspA family protein